jgi:hypothetical protein
VDIVGYSKLTVAKQLAIKGWFNDLLLQALNNLSPTERIIHDAGDGAAISFMSDPEDALFVANALRMALSEDLYPGLALRIGINLGPVKIVRDINGRPNIIGDGINSAQRVMGFAAPDQILVSRSYFEVVSCLSDEYALLFEKAINHRDKSGREHHVYEVRNAGPTTPAAPGAVASRPPATSKQVDESAQKSPEADSELDAGVLGALSKELSRHLGLIAPLLIKKTAKKARDQQELVRMLADSIPIPHERSAFVRAVSSALNTSPGPEMPVEAPFATRNVDHEGSQTGYSKDALARVEAELTSHIGPMAKILVNKGVKTARSDDELIATLAGFIDNEQARLEFLSSAKIALGSR